MDGARNFLPRCWKVRTVLRELFATNRHFFTGTSSTRNQRTIYQRSVPEWKERKELGSRVGPVNGVVHRPLVEHETCSKSETIRRGPRN